MAPLMSLQALALGLLALAGSGAAAGNNNNNTGTCSTKKPNIVLIMSDDQDRLLQSPSHMPALQELLVAQGTEFVNHYATVSNCCPSRASLLRGQNAHNNNITHVRFPGGNFDKWVMAGENENYLPHWIKAAGYRAEYVGKFLNGYSTANYYEKPGGWDHVDSLLEPYIGDYNNPVFSANGERPVVYRGFHQTDAVRIKALDRLDRLTDDTETPFYLTITPYAPHVSGSNPPVPATRHENAFANISVPRYANWNPADEIQQQKSVYLKTLDLMNATQEAYADFHHRRRLQALLGVDEIVEDVVGMLDAKGMLDNTYVIYTTDNGYHIGAHRLPAGKALPYVMDSNLPLVVRGPGVPAGQTSKVASAHLDFAPTFLEIMGLAEADWPPFLDGRSLLSDWHDPVPETPPPVGAAKEIMNIEFWGQKVIEAPHVEVPFMDNTTYKTLRIVSEGSSWMFAKWCTNEMELYNTTADPWEINNLAYGEIAPETQRVLNRLNAILLVTKSCEGDTCRDPWSVLQPPNLPEGAAPIASLPAAMAKEYDEFFAGLPEVHFRECMLYQDEENEMPFYPPGAENGLGKAWRNPTDNWVASVTNGTDVPTNEKPAGGPEQRHASLAELLAGSRTLTDAELGRGNETGTLNNGGPGVVD
ncbi:arylsulfatase [Xylariomycetidae sp. FL0641]|nr:arylsulfatase [Xylariomycetidae sp. FL0641]